jgi:hypothetical protein
MLACLFCSATVGGRVALRVSSRPWGNAMCFPRSVLGSRWGCRFGDAACSHCCRAPNPPPTARMSAIDATNPNMQSSSMLPASVKETARPCQCSCLAATVQLPCSSLTATKQPSEPAQPHPKRSPTRAELVAGTARGLLLPSSCTQARLAVQQQVVRKRSCAKLQQLAAAPPMPSTCSVRGHGGGHREV